MSVYDECMPQMMKMLTNLEHWLDQACEYAEAREFDPERLVNARLSPDMFALVKQVQAACDAAKFTGARLSETEAPRNEDTETTLAELRERIAVTRAFLEGLDPAAFEGAGERILTLAMLRGGSVTGADYLREFAIPNFYFHVSMAYAILRHNGVKLGKRTYIGKLNIKMPEG